MNIDAYRNSIQSLGEKAADARHYHDEASALRYRESFVQIRNLLPQVDRSEAERIYAAAYKSEAESWQPLCSW